MKKCPEGTLVYYTGCIDCTFIHDAKILTKYRRLDQLQALKWQFTSTLSKQIGSLFNMASLIIKEAMVRDRQLMKYRTLLRLRLLSVTY